MSDFSKKFINIYLLWFLSGLVYCCVVSFKSKEKNAQSNDTYSLYDITVGSHLKRPPLQWKRCLLREVTSVWQINSILSSQFIWNLAWQEEWPLVGGLIRGEYCFYITSYCNGEVDEEMLLKLEILNFHGLNQ